MMEAAEKPLPSLTEMSSAAHFTIGYCGFALESLVRSWSRLMATEQGRAEALDEIARIASPLNLNVVERVEWVVSVDSGRTVTRG